ncbi:MAG: hypothetical protein HY653_00140 [Acidobacteria bacterium]|nr:hypothetical protein [Acidobacteriota bacterium]
MALGVLFVFSTLVASEPTEDAVELSADELIARLQRQNRDREERLESYTVRRIYRVANEVSEKRAEVEVEMRFHSPDQMEFEIQRQTGSKFLVGRVIKRMMEAEEEALTPENKRRSALTAANYEFTLLGPEQVGKRRTYRLGIKPRREDTYLLEGSVWIDAEDFALVRAEGEPSKRPSFWTRQVDIVRTYRKVGPFWLPDRLENITEVLLFGRTTVGIESGDYRIRLRRASVVAAQH